MHVPAPVARQLANGTATQLRIPTRPDQRLLDGRRVPTPCPVHIGRDYPIRPIVVTDFLIDNTPASHREVEPALKHDDGTDVRILITHTVRGTLTDLTYKDAKREGYRASTWRTDLVDTWKRHYTSLTIRPDMPVWVLTVTVQHDRALFLAPSGSQATHVRREGDQDTFTGLEHDYTTTPSASIDGAEIVHLSPAWKRASELQHADAQDRRKAARQLARNLRAA